MKNLKRLPLFLLLSVCFAFAACSSDDDDNNDGGDEQKNTAQQQQEKIVAQLNNNTETAAFAEAFNKLDLSNSTASGFAIFAVTDQALQNQAKASASISQAVLKRHVAEGVFDLTSISKLKHLKALSGDTLSFALDGSALTVNGVALGTPKIVGNNIIFTINSLIPVAKTVDPVADNKIYILTTFGDDGALDTTFKFEYTSNLEKLSSYTETFSNGEHNNYKFTYDTDGNLSKYERYSSESDSIDISRIFAYYGDTISVTNLDGGIDVLMLEPQTGRLLTASSGGAYTTYGYDSRGNLSKKTDGDDVETYSYDNKKSMFSNTGLPVWFWIYDANENFDLYAGANNILKKEYSSSSDIDTFSYKYDEDGYPIEIYELDELTASIMYLAAPQPAPEPVSDKTE